MTVSAARLMAQNVKLTRVVIRRIPLVAVGFAFGGGGGSGKDQKATSMEGAGAGSGGGGGVKPVAVIIVGKDGVRVEPVRRGAATIVEKMGEAVSRIIEKRGEKTA